MEANKILSADILDLIKALVKGRGRRRVEGRPQVIHQISHGDEKDFRAALLPCMGDSRREVRFAHARFAREDEPLIAYFVGVVTGGLRDIGELGHPHGRGEAIPRVGADDVLFHAIDRHDDLVELPPGRVVGEQIDGELGLVVTTSDDQREARGQDRA